MPLTDVSIRAAKPREKSYRLKDSVGLYLEVRPEGGKWWRYRYKVAGRENMLSLGTYPEVGLSAARARRDELRRQVAQGIDPGHARRAEKETQATASANSFETIAREWYETRRHDWADSYGEKIMARFVADVFPYVGASPIAELKPPELLEVFRRIEKRGALETAQRARENVSQVFRYAVATGRAGSDPSRDLKDALRKPIVQHFPAITKPQRLGELLRAIDGYGGTLIVRAALKLAPMLMLRPGELRHAQWPEFDLDGALWTIPAARMKRQKVGKLQGPPHLVPLPAQAVEVLRELHRLTGAGPWVFRGERHHDRPMSENTVNAALRGMGFPREEVTGHGFRATARTMLAERLSVAENVIEAQLAHTVRDTLGRAYNRTEFIDQRREMMQVWANYLDKLRKGADVIPLREVPAATPTLRDHEGDGR
jgi:integrase